MSKPHRGHPRSQAGAPHQDASYALGGLHPASSPAPASGRRPTYPQAVASYEAGLVALQARRYADAVDAFRRVLTQYPEEKELGERVRVYLSACERQLAAHSSEPKNLEERLYAATLALNAGDVDNAVRHLEAVVAEDGDHDGALYMLGVGYALRDDVGTAWRYLRRAIECNPANRLVALQDEDLERLLREDPIREALEQPFEPSSDPSGTRIRSFR